MLVYEKYVTETVNGEEVQVKHLFGTTESIPDSTDNQLVYKDADGDILTTVSSANKFCDDGAGGIVMIDSNNNRTFVGVNIKKTDNSLVNLIPGGSYTPDAKVLSSIAFKHAPTTVSYIEGQALNTAGIVIEATFATGEKEDVTADCTFDPTDEATTTMEMSAIEASYTYPDSGDSQITKTAECAITVIEKVVESIAVKAAPTKVIYDELETLNMTGLVLNVTYNSGVEEVAYGTAGITYNPPEGTGIVEDTVVTISFGGQTITQNVMEKVLESISVNTAPTKIAYTTAEALDMEGLVITATYNSGDEDINYGDAGLTYDPAESTAITQNTVVTISYGGETTTQEVTFAE